MMKKYLLLLVGLLLTISANAQFEMGTKYAGASLSGFNMNYSGAHRLSLGLSGQAGYFVQDNLMVMGELSYQHQSNPTINAFHVGVGGRYYMVQNGIFLGANLKFVHANRNYNDLMPGVEVGYAYYISRTVTIEPAIYYQQSFKKHSDFSAIGLKIGLGVYL